MIKFTIHTERFLKDEQALMDYLGYLTPNSWLGQQTGAVKELIDKKYIKFVGGDYVNEHKDFTEYSYEDIK